MQINLPIDAPEFAELKTLITELGEKIMAQLGELKAAVAAEKTVVDSAVTLLNGLSEKIAALSLNQADVDALAAEVKGQAQELSDAVAANTPAAPPTE